MLFTTDEKRRRDSDPKAIIFLSSEYINRFRTMLSQHFCYYFCSEYKLDGTAFDLSNLNVLTK